MGYYIQNTIVQSSFIHLNKKDMSIKVQKGEFPTLIALTSLHLFKGVTEAVLGGVSP